MTRRFKIGDPVARDSEAGRVSGTIVAIHTGGLDYNGRTTVIYPASHGA